MSLKQAPKWGASEGACGTPAEGLQVHLWGQAVEAE